jgi:phage tail sheath gpL-like
MTLANSFNDIPATTRRPWAWIEFDPSNAQQGAAIQERRILVLGIRNSGGAVLANVPTLARSADEVASYFGSNSQIASMAVALFANNKVQEATFVGINAPSGGASAGSFALTGTATAAGTLYAYLAGTRFPISVASGDTATEIGDALETAINADTEIPFTASNTTGTVTVTAAHNGIWGNNIEASVNYYQGESLPAGVSVTVTKPAAGTGAVDPSAVWAIIGDAHYTDIVTVDLATAELAAVETELADRWGPERQVDAHLYMGINETYANAAALGAARNSAHTTFIPADQSPTPTYKWAAALCGVAAKSLSIDPARPLQTLELVGVLPPKGNKLFDKSERNLLLYDGMSVFATTNDGRVILERVITAYQTNAYGAADTAYLDLNTKATLSYLRYSFRTMWQNRFPRHKLRDNGARIPAGQAIMTPNLAKGEIVGWFRQMEDLGLVEGIDQFKRDMIVEINAQDPTRLDVKIQPNVVNQLRVLGMQVAFLL